MFLPSVLIDFKQSLDIFALWEEPGVKCINMEHININTVGIIISTGYIAKSSKAFNPCQMYSNNYFHS